MSKLVKKSVKKAIDFAPMCKDKTFADHMIAVFKTEATTTIQSIIGMSRAVEAMDRRYRSEEISKNDLDYFCLSVGLKKLSSQFRKFVCIGRYADKLSQYIEKMPQSISVLYEITTLDAEKFENLIEQNLIYPDLSLSKLKILAGKPLSKKQSTHNKIDSITINFEPDALSEQAKNLLILILRKVKQNNDLTVTLPSTTELASYIEEQIAKDDFVDIESRVLPSQIHIAQ